ncbi:hypothetical protein RUM44_010117 [Polyplax serrata]|uniref:Laminin subunit gamma-1 n=1 Tax=Polyplax serrata TaxID=468196 RepID=A0ABR1AW45_POLSC
MFALSYVCAFLAFGWIGFSAAQHNTTIPCYDHTGKAQRCVPEFGNAAFNVLVEATNTCGMSGRTDYCIQTESSQKYCSSCFPPGSPDGESHPPEYLTDFNNERNQTWWQSETMLESIQYPNQVNLTLHLHKAYDITYVRLLFQSPRPESFVIYKRTTQDGPWIPYQYFSATCRDTYGLQQQVFARRGDETRAFCTSEYSDMTPLTGGSVPFSTLEGRPSAYNFDNSPELQEWVTATDIRITFDRLNTFGDELWREPVVLKSYFYAVMDLAVGARCKCNGHASECPLVGNGWERRCRCEHHTAGPDCNECLPFYNDAPWSRATKTDAHECRACNCNGFSNRCYFDRELYEQTGHGGHCIDCAGFRDGPNCERCKENYYQQDGGHCVACNCNEMGSRSKQCTREGKCQCKPGVTGEKCDRCDKNFYDFGPEGCKPCGCVTGGSLHNEPHCDPFTGTCLCKENVEGKRCQECKPGYFNLDLENQYGCTPCFCYGQSSVCKSTSGYSKVIIESSFARSNEKWSAIDYSRRPAAVSYNAMSQTIGVQSQGREPIYFLAPTKFLGDQRASYNQHLEFRLRIGETGAAPTVEDVVLQGAGLSISQPIFGQNNPLPSTDVRDYRFRLHEHPEHGWQPRLSSRDFMSVLANLTAIKIRGTYFSQGVGFLDEVKLRTARRGAAGQPANWIETCTCPSGYIGQFCESCAHKYRHEPPNGGPFARCVPCNCNGHADSCEEDTGRCICQHNTEGENCELCAKGFYGNSLEGTPEDCKACPCPNRGACIQIGPGDENVVCLECPLGYGGPRCDLCSDGFFGDPNGKFGESKKCQPCDCNTNVDPNAVGNCNRTTGECLKCIYNTGGPQCDQCLPGFFGDALAIPKGDCKMCQCYRAGTIETDGGPPLCDQLTGQCHCKSHVQGVNCDVCEDGYFNIVSGEGCESCACDPIGSYNKTCDISTGQCYCRPGVVGKRCDMCAPYHYGFSDEGCKPCECDLIGSSDPQCDPSGQCPCLENVEGRRCDRCKENKYDRQRGCLNCEPCYNLVQDAANVHRSKLRELEKLLDDIANSPTVIDDAEFEDKLKEVQTRVEALEKEAKFGVGGIEENNLSERLSEVSTRLQNVRQMIDEVNDFRVKADVTIEHGQSNVTLARDIVDRSREHLQQALEFVQADGYSALQRALERSDEFGQQNKQMSEISQEARHLANAHEKMADMISQIAEKSENISTEAYKIAKDAVKRQRNTTDELENLKSEIGRMEDRAQLEALGVYEEVYNLQLPEVTANKLKEESEFLINTAVKIKKEAEDLLLDHTETWDELSKQIQESQYLLEQGEEQQNVANDLLANADVARNKAKEAVKLGEQTIKEAHDTFNILSDFEKKVDDSKDKAQEALAMVDDIVKMIDMAVNKTREAESALQGAEVNAQIARNVSKEAQTKFAEEASKEAHEIKREAEETKKKAGRLRDEADSLSGRVAVTESRLKKLEEQAELDEVLTTEAKKKVGQTKISVSEASKQVQKALMDVSDILGELQDLSDIDEESLNDLERRLDEAEEEVLNSKLDERMQFLKEEKMSQSQLLGQYQDEVDKLREEVANIEKIAGSLPEGCFKRGINLEL